LKQGQEIVGNRTKIKVVKNKVAPPFKVAEVDIMYGKGISREGEIVDLGAEYEVLQKSGAWYSYDGERIGQGRENIKTYLKENPEVRDEIDPKIRKAMGVGASLEEASAQKEEVPVEDKLFDDELE